MKAIEKDGVAALEHVWMRKSGNLSLKIDCSIDGERFVDNAYEFVQESIVKAKVRRSAYAQDSAPLIARHSCGSSWAWKPGLLYAIKEATAKSA